MSKLVVLIGLLSLCSGCVAPISAEVFVDGDVMQKRDTWTVAIFDFEYQGEEDGALGTLVTKDGGPNAGATVASVLSTSLAKVPRVKMVERSRLDALIAEQEQQASRMIDQSDAVRIGKLSGADAVCLGQVTKYTHWKDLFAAGTTVGFAMRIVDVESGLVLMSGNVNNVGVGMELTPNTQVCAKEVTAKLTAEIKKQPSSSQP